MKKDVIYSVLLVSALIFVGCAGSGGLGGIRGKKWPAGADPVDVGKRAASVVVNQENKIQLSVCMF